MAKDHRAGPGKADESEVRADQEATRRAFGIDALPQGEELTDDSTFADVEGRMLAARLEADGGAPSQDELLLEEIVSEPPERRAAKGSSDDAPTLAPPPASAAEVSLLEAELQGASDRDAVARLALRLARRHARAAALFVVHRGIVAGLRGEADGLARPIEGVVVPAEAESFLAQPVASGKSFRGGASVRAMDAHILRALGRSDARDRLVVPISIRGRVVNLLYADNGVDALAETSIAALGALASCVAAAYERLIVQRKRRAAVPASGS